jgi:hypothetical protein
MANKKISSAKEKSINDFLDGKSETTLELYHHFIKQFKKTGEITIHPAKTMIGIANANKRIAWINQLGKISYTLFSLLRNHILTIYVFKR